jgi:hypothetical protein
MGGELDLGAVDHALRFGRCRCVHVGRKRYALLSGRRF